MDQGREISMGLQRPTESPRGQRRMELRSLRGKDRASLKMVEEQIEGKGYAVKLELVEPPRPIRNGEIKKEEAKKWIEMHPQADRPVAEFIVENTRFISQEEFEDGLIDTTKGLNSVLNKLPAGERSNYVVVTGSTGDSNHWVTELAFPHLEYLPNHVVSYAGELFADGATYPSDKIRLVFFDDGIYSGSQMEGNVGAAVRTALRSGVNDVEVYVVAPFTTKEGKQRVTTLAGELSEYVKQGKNVKIEFTSGHQEFESIEQTIDRVVTDPPKNEDVKKKLKAMYPGGGVDDQDEGLRRRTMTYFAHKVADNWSTLGVVYESGQVNNSEGDFVGSNRFIPKIEGPYKSFYTLQYLFTENEDTHGKVGIKDILPQGKDKLAPEIESVLTVGKASDGTIYARISDSSKTLTVITAEGRTATLGDHRPYISLRDGDTIVVGQTRLEARSGTLVYKEQKEEV